METLDLLAVSWAGLSEEDRDTVIILSKFLNDLDRLAHELRKVTYAEAA